MSLRESRRSYILQEIESCGSVSVVELAKRDEKVVKWLGKKKVKKVIFVPGKLLNFVV